MMRHDLSFNALLQSHYRAMQRKLEAIADAERCSAAGTGSDVRASAPSTSAPSTSRPAGGAVDADAAAQHASAGVSVPRQAPSHDDTIDASTRDLLARISRL